VTSETALFWFETTSFVVLGAILLFDVLLIFKRPHVPSHKESVLWVSFYATLAVIFALLLGLVLGDWNRTSEFVAGWLTEYSLSIDNLFVFIIIMARLKVPTAKQQSVLMIGIIISLVLRGGFIVVGAAIISAFSGIFYLFGAFLIYTAYHQAFRTEEDDEDSEMRLITWLKQKKFSPMLIVLFSIGITDLLFAFDSIPAIFGITTDPFIVFTANIFALMGLRQLYFLLGGLMTRLEHLKYGIAAILGFIGVKLVLHAMHENSIPFINGGKHIEWAPDISTEVSLGFIIGAIAISAITSAIAARKKN
jgi:tellurite resistance protein TerC